MWKALKARLYQGYRTGKFPVKAPPALPERFAGRAEVDQEKCAEYKEVLAEVCPVKAISFSDGKISLDMGKCIFCRKCAEKCEGIRFGKEYRLAAMKREDLIVNNSYYTPPLPQDKSLAKLCGRSLKIRQVSAGGCAACELDFNVLNTLAWDMGRFGIQVAASPRHADCLLVTGPVSENMLLALKKTYEAVPTPAFVIACGACAISGGIYAGFPAVHDGVAEIFPVDLYVPGCPPHPAVLLEALLYLMCGRKK